jgi:hypothetical protein
LCISLLRNILLSSIAIITFPHIIRRQQLMGGNAGCGGYRFDCKFGICKIIKSISLKKVIMQETGLLRYIRSSPV